MTLKKVLGIFLMVIAALFGLVIILSIFDLMTDLEDEWKGSIYFTLVFFVAVFGWLFRYGLKLFKNKPKAGIPTLSHEELDAIQPIHFSVKLEKKEFLKINFIVAYSHPVLLWLTGISLLMLSSVPGLGEVEGSSKYVILFFMAYGLILLPITIYVRANKIYKNNVQVNEEVFYDFDTTEVKASGSGFSHQLQLTMLKSIKEYKNWYFIFTQKNAGFFIPKRVFKNHEENENLRKILSSVQGVKFKKYN